LTGENIICFAKDWNEHPTSNNHVMAELAKHNRVLWLNSISTRTPNLASGRDLQKIVRKLAGFLRGPERMAPNLWVYTPLVLPFPHSRIARRLNGAILKATLRCLRHKLKMRTFQLWTFLPNTGDYIGRSGESVAVYYCVDDWAGFSYVEGQKIREAEERLCERADIVFVTASPLVAKKSRFNPETHLATHGVDHALFAAALEETLPVPPDIAALPQPVLGFYGTIQDWVDLDLLVYLAERHPEWTLALVGDIMVDVTRLKAFPNVHFLGRKPHAELPNCCKGFAVGIIPYVVNERMLYVNPLKLREYLSAGLPVVSVAIPEVGCYKAYCHVAPSYAEFEQGIETALRADSPEQRRQRSEAMRAETWERKVAAISAHIERVKAKKCLSQQNTVLV
jgi:glycosyltransferase involved in cell wall biosynthesis